MPAAAEFSSRLQEAMTRRKTSALRLAPLIGVSDTQVSNWRHGLALPSIAAAEKLVEVLDWPSLLAPVVAARTRRCTYGPCSATYPRERGKRLFCSTSCWRNAVKNPAARVDARQRAIDENCRQCEPEGVCRTADCPLRAFSPFLFIPLTAA
jgi:hypothetical protein